MQGKFISLIAMVILFCAASITLHPNRMRPEQRAILDGFAAVHSGAGTVIKTWHEGQKQRCYVLTSYHVVEGSASGVPVSFPVFNAKGVRGPNVKSFIAEIVAFDLKLDYAILASDCPVSQQVVRCASTSAIWQLALLDEVYAVGRPCFQAVWVTKGHVASFNLSLNDNRPENDGSAIGHSASISFGNSGGPLFNSSWEQIGVNINTGKTLTAITGTDDKLVGHCTQPVEHVAIALSLDAIYQKLGAAETAKYFGADLRH